MQNSSQKCLEKDSQAFKKLELDMTAFWNYVDMMYFSPTSISTIFLAKISDITQSANISLLPTSSKGTCLLCSTPITNRVWLYAKSTKEKEVG